MNIKTFSIGGIHPEENKLTHETETQVAPLPHQAVFPLSQHIGAPARPIVQKGDKVKVGTLIAEASSFISAPIHSSVSGTVAAIDNAIEKINLMPAPFVLHYTDPANEAAIQACDNLSSQLDKVVELIKSYE